MVAPIRTEFCCGAIAGPAVIALIGVSDVERHRDGSIRLYDLHVIVGSGVELSGFNAVAAVVARRVHSSGEELILRKCVERGFNLDTIETAQTVAWRMRIVGLSSRPLAAVRSLFSRLRLLVNQVSHACSRRGLDGVGCCGSGPGF